MRRSTNPSNFARWWPAVVLAATAFLLAGCGGSSSAVRSDVDLDAAPDSLGLEEFMALSPETRAARRELASAWRKQAQRHDTVPERIEALDVAAGFAPDDARTWLDLALIRGWGGDHLQAESCLVQAAAAVRRMNDLDYDRDFNRSERDALSHRTALLRAWLHYVRAEWREGLDWAEAASQLGAGDDETLRVLGLLQASLQRRSQAIAIADDLQRQDIFDASGSWIMGALERAQGRLRVAFNHVKDLRPEAIWARACWRDMGMIAEQLGEWSYAERWYRESGAALPEKRGGYLLQVTHPRLGPPAEAREMPIWIGYDRFYVTGSISAYTALALARFHQAATVDERIVWGGAVVDAAGILLRREEEHTWARRARGLVFIAQDRTDRGLADLSRAARDMGSVADDDAYLQAGLGRAWLQRRNQDRALPYLRRAVVLVPDRAEVWSDLGLALVMTGDEYAARGAFDRALELDANLATAWYNRGLLHLHAEDLVLAEADLAEAARLAPDNPDLVTLLEQVRRELGRRGESP